MVYKVERRKTVYQRGARPPQPRRRSSLRNHRLSGWEKAEFGADDSRLYSWLRMGGHGAAHWQGRPALAAVLSLAVWTVQSLPGGKSMFSRFFSLVGSEGGVTVSRSKNGALDPVGSQAALERFKKYLEGAQKNN